MSILADTLLPMTENCPRIRTFSDDRGHIIQGFKPELTANALYTGAELQPGDAVSFHCTAEDPKGRDLEWTIHVSGQKTLREPVASGADVSFTWTVQDKHVRDDAIVFVELRTAGIPY